jgi:hypothetical protein
VIAVLAFLFVLPTNVFAQAEQEAKTASALAEAKAKQSWGAEEFLKLIPAESFAVVIPNLQRFIDRGQPIAEEVNVHAFGRPKTLLSLVTSALGLSGGYDLNGPWILISLDPNFGSDQWAVGMAVENLDTMLARSDLSSEDFANGKIVKGELDWRSECFFMMRDRCIWVSKSDKLLQKLTELKTLDETLRPEDRKDLADKDLIVRFSAATADPGANRDRWFEEVLGDNAQAKSLAEVLSKNVDEFRFTLKFDKGVHTQARLGFKDNPEVRKTLSELVGPGESEMKGLATENLIAASSVRGMSESSPELMRELLRGSFLFGFRNELSDFQMSAVSQLFRDVAAQIDHTQIAAYTTSDMRSHGVMGFVAVLTPKGTPEQFVEELRSLSSFVSARLARDMRVGNVPVDYEEIDRLVLQLGSETEQQRKAATTKLRIIGQPALEALEKADKSQAIDIAPRAAELARRIRSDIKQEQRRNPRNGVFAEMKPQFLFRRNANKPKRPVVEILLEPGAATDRVNKQLTPMFGSEWKRMRFAVLEKHVVVMFGSDQKLLEQTIAAVESEDTTLAEDIQVQQFRQRVGSQRLAEWHFSAAKIVSIANAMTGKPGVEADGGLSSLSVSKQPTGLRVDLFAPTKELKIWYKRFGF